MRLKNIISVATAIISLCPMPSKAKEVSPCDSVRMPGIVHSISLSLGAEYVASSVEDDIREKIPADEKIYVNTALPLHIKYGFTFTDTHIPHYLPGGYQGVGLALMNYGALEKRGASLSGRYIGYPVLAYVYQGGPFLKFKHNLSLNYEWNFGASFGWKPWSEATQAFNLTVGSRVNAYLNLNFSLLWQINPHTGIFGGLSISHFSNGNTSFPNPGVNQMGLKIGMVWTLNPMDGKYPDALPDTIKKGKVNYDLVLWGASRRRVYRGGENPVLLPGHFACAGISISPMVRLNPWWRVGGALDIQWDQSSDKKKNYISGDTTDDIKFSSPSFIRQISWGLSAHGELRMPIFALNVGIGYNLYAPKENRGSYQNVTLKTYFTEKIFLNIGYQLRNFYQQGSLMLGLGLTL